MLRPVGRPGLLEVGELGLTTTLLPASALLVLFPFGQLLLGLGAFLLGLFASRLLKAALASWIFFSRLSRRCNSSGSSSPCPSLPSRASSSPSIFSAPASSPSISGFQCQRATIPNLA